MYKACGEGVETVEHALLNYRQAKQVQQIAPIQWDGAKEKQGCFKAGYSCILLNNPWMVALVGSVQSS